jgi:hypothetical protein
MALGTPRLLWMRRKRGCFFAALMTRVFEIKPVGDLARFLW